MKCLFTPAIKKFCKAPMEFRTCHPTDAIKLAKTCVECAGFNGSRMEFWEEINKTALNIGKLRIVEDLSLARSQALEEVGTWMGK